MSESYLDHFRAHRLDLIGVSLADYPLAPAADRPLICASIEKCFREKVDVIGVNHSMIISDDGTRTTVLTRWLNSPIFDRRGRVAEVYSIGHVIKGRKTKLSQHD